MADWLDNLVAWLEVEPTSIYTLINTKTQAPVGVNTTRPEQPAQASLRQGSGTSRWLTGIGKRQPMPTLVREYASTRRLPDWYIHRRQRPLRRVQVVLPRHEALWEMRNWQPQGNRWYGRYQVDGKSWAGYAEKESSRYWAFYILDQPEQLNSHICFVSKGKDGQGRRIHYVHFVPTKPTSLSRGIGGVEYQIGLAIKRNGG